MLSRRQFLSVAGLCAVARPSRAAPSAVLWERWLPETPGSPLRVDHQDFSAFLQHYRHQGGDGIARFDYQAAQADQALLQHYVTLLSKTAPGVLARPEQFAFWVNLYNALTLTVVLRHYPVASIRDIDTSPGLFAAGPWGEELLEIDGQALTLDDIEHRILRPIWQDPRIHYAVNCASLGCPDLPARALASDNLEQQLNALAVAFVNHPRAATITQGKLIVSSLYDWYAEDFGGTPSGVLQHLSLYAAPPLAQQLSSIKTIDSDRYDWALNDTLREP